MSIKRDTSERRSQISAMVRQHGSVQVADLAKRFRVSMQTIRKDLHFLTEHGVTARSYGGAIASDVVGSATTAAIESPVAAKLELQHAEKERIGRFAAGLINPGESIVLDSGTTTLQIARFLPDIEDLTVVTNDLNIVTELAGKSHIRVVLIGGELRRKNMAFYSAQTVAALSELAVDKLFLGVDGIDIERGITTHHEAEAILNRKMADVARQTVAVTDSSKFGRVCLHRIIGVGEIDMLITDEAAPDTIATACRSLGVDLRRV
ncbi:DeoR family transcriptional regulator [Nitrospirillum amazonense]|uniref:DeoR family transcriptional regulator n=1 Tax=Nitrospirillum amazonense TaxID=28077 RepID=A0A560F102_9PROT|nr:transcriptional repressor AgaR [Nitrospirillum amazonense]TWB15284.1 DeoR family transcriptional regulator [Nitrospirillum amazonense]